MNIEKLDWSTLTKEDIAYYAHTDKSLSYIYLPRDTMMCSDANCKDVKHRRDICSMYNDLESALYEGSKPYYKYKNKTHNIRPGWNKYVV